MPKEIRYLSSAHFRAKSESRIEGYAAVFNSPSEDLGGFIEVIRPGAFGRAIREGQDVRCLFNHIDSEILGRTKSGTLRLAEDSTGLLYECRLAPTQRARDIYASIGRGDIDQSSFGFIVRMDRWPKVEPMTTPLREILDVDLLDVSPVTFAAYPATTVEARSLWPDGVPREVQRRQTGAKIGGCYRLTLPESPRVASISPALETDRALARVRLARMR